MRRKALIIVAVWLAVDVAVGAWLLSVALPWLLQVEAALAVAR